jgi:pimeloyl-ACP methyl ester carboxylesterase
MMPGTQTPESRFVTLGPWRFHYLEWGGAGLAARATPLVCLHGAGGKAEAWAQVGAVLGPHMRVLALDQRGHGQTEAPEPPTAITDMAGDLLLFADALSFRTFNLLGHSMGARVAAGFAAGHAERVEHLILSDPPHYPEEDMMAREWALLQARPEVFPQERALLQAMMATFGDLSGAWSRITCPTLFLHGTHSEALAPDVAKRIAGLIPRAKLVEIDSGHGIFRQNPEAALAAVREFLRVPV